MNSNGFFVCVDNEKNVWQTTHVFDAAKSQFQLLFFTRQVQTLFFGEGVYLTSFNHAFDFAQAVDGIGDGFPVCQGATEPALVHVILRRTLGSISNWLCRLALGANEKNAATIGYSVRNRLQSAVKRRHSLAEVDDVNAVTLAIDVALHLRVPAVGLVTKVNSSFQELTHREVRQCHVKFSFSGYYPPQG